MLFSGLTQKTNQSKQITESYAPQRIDNDKAMVIAFKYKSLYHSERSARLFTSDRLTSNLFLFDADERAYCMANFHVMPQGLYGHSVRVSVQFFRPVSFMERFFAPLYLNAHSLETGLAWNYHTLQEDPNFRAYRRAVLFGVFKKLKK